MSTQGRRGGTRRRRVEDTAATPAVPAIEPAAEPAPEPAAAHTGEAELLDERTAAISGGRPGLRLGRSLPGAIAGTLLVVGLTFGAALGPGGALGPSSDQSAAGDTTTAQGGAGQGGADGGGKDGDDKVGPYVPKDDSYAGDEGDGTDKPDGDEADATDRPDAPDPTRKPAPDRTPKPEPKDEPKNEPKDDPKDEPNDPADPIGLELAIKDDHPLLQWGSCAGLDFDYYKVVRSTDSTVTWPKGDNDELIGAVGADGYRKAWDKYAPHGKKAWYRVFCVRKTEDGYKAVNASNVKGIEVPLEPEPPTPPDPVLLGLEAEVNDEGKVVLSWSACEVDGFAFYKVVKSTWNEHPSYLPWTDGSEVIGVVGDRHATEWHDWAPDAGDTVYYRVQCIGYVGDHKVLLGQTAVVAVTSPE